MFQVKICGITNVEDALAVVESGGDAIGLNFFPGSTRCVEMETARRIVSAVRGQVRIVGVFVDASVQHMARLAAELPLEFLQLHGDEPPSRLRDLAPRRVIRAFRLRPERERVVVDFINAAQTLKAPPAAVLVDAYREGAFGGTGEPADWGQVRRLGDVERRCPLLLAGGLNPENVDQAIRRTRCDGVDVASGVEAAPGKKDAARIHGFVTSAMTAFRETAEDARRSI